MSTATKTDRAEAIQAADRFRAMFESCYERWEVAGSVRRLRPEVGDIEHVVISGQEAGGGLFGQTIPSMRVAVDALLDRGTVTLHEYGETKTHRNGDKYIGLDFEGRMHEIFMCDESNWGCILSIRTGSADFSRELVTRLRPRNFRQLDGSLWKISHVPREGFDREYEGVWLKHIPCPDEATMFSAAGLNIEEWPPAARDRLPA